MSAPLRIIVFLFLISGISAVAESSLQVTVLNTNARFRSGAPGNLQVQIDNAASGIREGILEATVLSNDVVILSHETPLTLAPGRSRRSLFIPLLNARTADVRVNFRFLAEGKSLDAGTHLFPSGLVSHDFLVLQAIPGKPDENHQFLARTLRLERIAPGKTSWSNYSTNTEWLPPEELPQNPLAYMAYDLVVLDQRALASAKEKSLAALNRWVDAGGSALVIPGTGVPLTDAAEKFLARLAVDDPAADGTRWLAPGLGRAVIWHDVLPGDGKTNPSWDRATAWLWKHQREQQTGNGREYSSDDLPGQITRTIVSHLGRDVRPLAFHTVTICFVLFILLTAAFDYFVLGRRFRKYTWVVFPIQCAAFAWVMMRVANDRLGNMQRTASVIVTDVGIDGRILRETKFVGFLPGKTAPADYRMESAVVFPVSDWSSNRGSVGTPHFFGSSVMRVVREKWTPCFVSETSMPGVPDMSALRWENWSPTQPEKEASLVVGVLGDVTFAAGFPERRAGSPRNYEDSKFTAGAFITESNVRGRLPVSQLAPQGSGENRDLIFPVLGSKRAVLVAMKTKGDTIHVYRKLYSTEVKEP